MKKFEVIILPTSIGLCKIYVYGFFHTGARGKVYATLNGVTVSSTGYHRNRTIRKAVEDLNQLIKSK
ncbi:hypothetical protein OEV82_09545 [Caldibacillus thermolactis]|jgi:hypothetical protein|uniref:Uncharacterized protein n=1 Tax=Pallidibacillus thermolactis TaxID=251051 RepID=A0ABT2WG73_9BACI|nr:hypothetical protein [Pallidibacillus thermolactis]MCU9594700.1 hypothetical protein [Pallidibacillus thermolactis]MCU9600420.1 hypothetical protein [Pallidibacillus thermolactis subsp. kokeshiiformis]MED1672134.1 hypothetical protein [Pallidibacillus thermolactis subsp. kokeshiiformis]